MLTKYELPDCPVATTLRLIGNKWKVFILQRLLDRPYGFNELQRSIEGISRKALSDNLKALEADSIITKTMTDENPPRSIYRLSSTGDSMRPIILALEKWGLDYQESVRQSS